MSTRIVTYSLGNVSETVEAETGTCRHCRQPITLLWDDWTDPDGCTNCMSNFADVYAPHEPASRSSLSPETEPKENER